MKLADQRLEQQVEAVMEQGRQVRPAPDVVRARLLARARAGRGRLARFLDADAGALDPRRVAGAANGGRRGGALVFVTAGTAAALYQYAGVFRLSALRSWSSAAYDLRGAIAIDRWGRAGSSCSEPVLAPARFLELVRKANRGRSWCPKRRGDIGSA